MSGNYPAGVTDADPEFDMPSVGDDDEEGTILIPCSYPGCERLTSFDPTYGDLCFHHIRADNE